MDSERMVELFGGLLDWVWYHSSHSSIDGFVRALHEIGFTCEEAIDILLDCSLDGEEEEIAKNTLNELWG